MVITTETQVRDIVLEVPNAIPVLEHFGIDYCCGGKHTLAEACTRGGKNIEIVLDEVERCGQSGTTSEIPWRSVPLRDLIEHILQKHHTFTRSQLALIQELASKVERRYGAAHPEIQKLNEMLATVSSELVHHLFCEENMLFPYIEQLEGKQKGLFAVPFDSIQQPIARMLQEHSQTGDEFRTLREITSNYQAPDDACTTYRALYRGLKDLEHDLYQHIHLENNILFPRALALESERA
jgi:regulator of cell morphogenesis and NO signaling